MTVAARLARIVFATVAILLGKLLLVQWAGSPFLTSCVNRKLGRLPDYRG